ncbi:MAG TPA: 4Fe-4S dicluster domain-containing protein, partial [Sunxiuqinia sp.]|nr:4Fe-4S dicluster domain-containing protein [Sunxiuqinia sp.]
MAKINPDFAKELKKYGAFDFNACYNCGNCTAVCSLSTEEDSFPREMVRYSVLGLDGEIQSSLKPWLCYYCGECSQTCPKTANPGELMMSLRRWLTAKYDWTGLSGLLYKSLPISILAFIVVAILVVAFGAWQGFNLGTIMHYGHHFELLAISAVFLLILLPNLIHMWYLIIKKPGIKIKGKTYWQGASELFVHMFTQKRALLCDDNQFRWFEHFILVIGYLALLFTTVVLDWFGTTSLFVVWLGYIESIIIFVVTTDFVINRIKKKKEISIHSQPSDWFFVIWLMFMGLSAFVVRLFIDTDLLANAQWIYLVHLIILAQWA